VITVIAEAGVNHNGDIGRAEAMVAAAAEAGADVVKFQAFSSAELVAQGTATAGYQRSNTGEADQAVLLKGLELSAADFARLGRACRDNRIEFLCTAFDVNMLGSLIDAGMRRIKIPSGELTNTVMLRQVAALNLPVILSTGMGTLEEVRRAVSVLQDGEAGEVTVLHCTSLYPAPEDAINLRAMVTMREAFGLPVGYSDHSMDDHIAIAAVALGAVMIEKHFTMDRGLSGPDHKASLEPAELALMIRRIRAVERALGDGIKQPAAGEAETAQLVRRSWHAARHLDAGTVLRHGDVVLKRPAHGLAPDVDPAGRMLKSAHAADEPIRLGDLA
jgi:N,N'-diacetyllegionaminate synthase